MSVTNRMKHLLGESNSYAVRLRAQNYKVSRTDYARNGHLLKATVEAEKALRAVITQFAPEAGADIGVLERAAAALSALQVPQAVLKIQQDDDEVLD